MALFTPTALVVVLVVWLSWSYFRKRAFTSVLDNIDGPQSESIWKGNLTQFFNRHGWAFRKRVAFDYGSVVKLRGLFGRPILYVSDPKALHTMIIKEERVYEESDSFIAHDEHSYFWTRPAIDVREHHRKQRKMLNPVFSVSHMRHMLPIFYGIVHKLQDAITSRVADGPQEIDILDWMTRTALELIGQGGLGHSFDPLVTNVRDTYGERLKQLTPDLQKMYLLRRVVPYVYKLGPAWLREGLVEMLPDKDVRKLKADIDILGRKSTEIFQMKKAALQKGDDELLQQVGKGKDIMSILMKANMVAARSDRLPDDELVAQMSTLIFAAMETTSSAVSRILHLLAIHPNVQHELRREIILAGAGNNMSYDELNRLRLLDAVCRETLRLYPPTEALARVYCPPLSEPIVGIDGQTISEIPVPKGTEIIIGVLGCNANKKMWGADAHEWKPERWLSPLPTSVTDAPIPGVYSNLMTFMGGKRACIGFKFSEMEMKVVLSVLLSSFTFSLEKSIEWNVAGVYFPTVARGSDEPQLPMKVGLYQDLQA